MTEKEVIDSLFDPTGNRTVQMSAGKTMKSSVFTLFAIGLMSADLQFVTESRRKRSTKSSSGDRVDASTEKKSEWNELLSGRSSLIAPGV